MNQTTKTIATRVSGAARSAFLPKYFGSRYLLGEATLYNWANQLARDYNGGHWEFYEISNGGFFVVPPESSEKLVLSVSGNGFCDALTLEAAGIVITLFALGELIERIHGIELCDQLIERHDALLDFAHFHAESALIFAAID